MDHIGVIRRAAQITWRNRALWIFGILLALSSGGGGGGGQGFQYRFNGNEFQSGNLPDFLRPFSNLSAGAIIGLVLGVLAVGLVLAVIGTIIYYVSTNSVIRMVDRIEETGARPTVRDGFRAGWSRPAFRMFLIGLVIGIPLALAIAAMVAVGLLPLLLTSGGGSPSPVGIALTVILMLIFVLVIIVAAVVAGVLTKLAMRAAAIDGLGVFESIAAGWRLIRRHLSDVALIWLLMLAIGIGWGLAMIPVVLLMLAIGGVAGGIPGLLVYALTRSVPAGAIIGVPLGVIVFAIPTLILSGIYTIFTSAVWTLTFREIEGKETVVAAAAAAPQLGPTAGEAL